MLLRNPESIELLHEKMELLHQKIDLLKDKEVLALTESIQRLCDQGQAPKAQR